MPPQSTSSSRTMPHTTPKTTITESETPGSGLDDGDGPDSERDRNIMSFYRKLVIKNEAFLILLTVSRC